ncbi:MAG: PKD domain-containing protein [Candidatus Gracilibacteria bacterium]|nr:PKD domain-containing protein [Candidatus Gracilibacteria bacterium]
MLKKIASFFLLYFIFFVGNTFADSVPVEDVFSDIKKDYKYYNELQTLYDKGMITPDSDGRFNPQKLLNRDEFVGIMMEVSCNKCIAPNVSYDFLTKYESKPLFFDINRTNKYFYCIAGADDSSFVSGYQAGTKCEDGTLRQDEKPFCPNNAIILEEALAIILRSSGILTNSEADIVRLKIASGEITQNLSEDVKPKNLDGSVYSFYPDFQKALDYQVVEYDKNGNEKIYKLVEVVDNKLRPKQAITKEDFLLISYVALRSNSCSEKSNDKLGLEINVYDKSCNLSILGTCNISNLSGNQKVFDFYGNVAFPYGDTINNDTGYIWRFYNYNTGEEIKKYGKYIDNYDFLKDGDYRVFLRAISDNGNTAEVYNDMKFFSNSNIDINYNYLGGNNYSFEGINNTNNNIIKYEWDFGDGTTGFGKTINHKYENAGTYKVTLIGTDSNNVKIEKTLYVNITNNINTTNNNIDISYNYLGGNNYNFEGINNTNNNIIKYEWNFGDGTTGLGKTVDHKYENAGTYKVTLIGTDSNNVKIEKIVYVSNTSITNENNNKLSIDANPIFGNSPLLINLSSIFSGNNNGATYFWDFGDGTSSLGKTNNHIYKEPGVYNVTLTLKDSNGEIYKSSISIIVLGNNSLDTDGDIVNNDIDNEINTPNDKILYICTLDDISNKRFDCLTSDKLGVYSEVKKGSDTDGDGVSDNVDNEINTPSDKILYICTLIDINSKSYDCKSIDMLGVYSEVKENSLVGDYDDDGINNLLDACPEIKGSEKNKGCPIFDKLCSLDTDCDAGYYCNSGICSPKQIAKSCEYTGGDLIFGNVVCNTCPCSNFVDFNSTLRNCDIVFPAIVSPDKKTIYSKGSYYEIKK